MAISLTTKTIRDAAGGSFPMKLLTDATDFFDAAVILDPVTGNWAGIDAQGRLKVAASDAIEVDAGGAQYNLSISAATALVVPGTATHAWIYVDANSAGRLRFRRDGTNPTASVGSAMEGGDERLFTQLGNLRFINDGGAVTIHVSYHHY